MLIGTRLRELREQKKMTQADIEERTGLLSCYISRVENGHVIPSLETLERFAGVLEVPMYRLFFFGDGLLPTPNLTSPMTLDELIGMNGGKGSDAQFLLRVSSHLSHLTEPDREIILDLAKRLAAPSATPHPYHHLDRPIEHPGRPIRT